jgi:hypothetical protein
MHGKMDDGPRGCEGTRWAVSCLLVCVGECECVCVCGRGRGQGGGWVVGRPQQARAAKKRKKCARENDQEIAQKRGDGGAVAKAVCLATPKQSPLY